MIPPLMEQQIRTNMEQAKAQAILSACFERINQRTETEAMNREESKMGKARLWWKEQDK